MVCIDKLFIPKMAVSWNVAACNLVDINRHFRGAYSILMMEAGSYSERSVVFNRLHGAISQKMTILTLAAVRT
jgi:hypothetical protein